MRRSSAAAARLDDLEDYAAARWPRLVRAAVLLGCRSEEAEDIAQATLTRCFVSWRRVSGLPVDERDAYVHRILVNTFISSRRRRWHGEAATDDFGDHADTDALAASDPDDKVVLDLALARLSDDHRAVVVLRHYAGLSESQTARALGVPEGTVKSRLSRALRTLASDPDVADLRGTP